MPTRPATPDRPVAQTIYLLSPAHCGGRRARILLGERAAFPLAVQLRDGGAPLGEVFRFLSGLYFRGKLAYAERFAFHTNAPHGVLVITPGRGLVPPETIVTIDEVQRIAEVGVAPCGP